MLQQKQQTMSPHDVVILLKIASMGDQPWFQSYLATELGISQSEISKSVQRCKNSGLLDISGKRVMRLALMEFLQYGIRYVFPQKPGPVVRGVPTSHSAYPLNREIQSTEHYVWPYGKGSVRGHSIQPLHPSVPGAALNDQALYELLALVDAIRVGRAREREIAISELKKRLEVGE